MRRTSDRDDPERGLSAALKALTVVAAVAVLALVAGKSAYTTGAATETGPTYQLLHSATGGTPAASAGVVRQEMPVLEPPLNANARATQDDPPVATF